MLSSASPRLVVPHRALLLLAFALSRLPLASAAAEPATELRLFAPAWRDIGTQRPQDVARKFTVIFGHLDPNPFHAGNPATACFKYVLGPYVDKAEMARLPRGALASDASGGVVKARDWANWLVVPDSAEWLDYVGRRVSQLMDSPFDGIFVDSLGTAPVSENYTATIALNPHTRQPYTKAEWLAAEVTMLHAVRAALPAGKRIVLNGLGPGPRYWTEPAADSPRVLLDAVDGAMSERIWRDPKSKLDAWPSLERWTQEIRMIQDVEQRGLMGFWWTKCWSNGTTSRLEPKADVLVPQWRRFALCSYLLAAGPHSYFNFDTDRDDQPKSNAAEYFPEYDAPLGHATGAMEPIRGTGGFARRFSNGLVLVNPTATTIELAEWPWPEFKAGALNSAGEAQAYTGRLSLRSHTGLLLTRP